MDHSAINHAIARLSLLATDDVPPNETLRELCAVASRAMNVDGVGVMLTDATGNRFAHASTDTAADVERLQEFLQAGPCKDAATSGETVTATDEETFARWVDFARGIEALQIGAMAAVPMMARGRCWGVLDLYRRQRLAWTTEELDAAALLANVATAHVVMAADRDTARAAQDQLAHQSNHDHLTGLPNRALVFDRLEHALAVAERHQGATVGLLFIDVDDFKAVNDTRGHAIGDVVLQQVARRLVECTRDADTVGRLAGDEFVVICDELPVNEAATIVVEAVVARIHAALNEPVQTSDGPVVVRVSIGTAVADPLTMAAALLADADRAMYKDKADSDTSGTSRDTSTSIPSQRGAANPGVDPVQ